MKSRKSKKIKQLAVKGLVNGKLKLGRVRPKLIGFFWHKGVTRYGSPRPEMMSELELKLVYNKDNFIELPAVWDGDIVNMVLHNESKDPTLSAIPLKALQRKGDYSPFCYAVAHAKDKNYPIILSPEEDNTFLLRTATTYYINIGEGYILIDNRKYRFDLEDLILGLDMDGDWVSTHMLHSNLVCNANSRIGRISYKKIKILGEL